MALINSQKVLGIVTEYNPFHNGHLYHIEASKVQTGADSVVAVMSAHFTQRGEPAIADPHTRAKWAVESGADLVVALPTLFSTASAGYFAYGSISILEALGFVDTLCFGSESGNISELKGIEQQLRAVQTDFEEAQKKDASLSYANHRDQFIKMQDSTINLSRSNDILGLAYLEALQLLHSSIEPETIQRIHAAYKENTLTGSISSATAIRHAMQGSNPLRGVSETVPLCVSQDLFSKDCLSILPNWNLWQEWILFELRRSTLEQLSQIHDMAEGMPQRMKTKAIEHSNYKDFEEELKTKIYTTGRLKRVMAKLLLGITKEDLLNDFKTKPEYIRILAFNEKGRSLLNSAKPNLPLITNAKHFRPETPSALRQWEIDNTASDLYHLLLKDSLRRGGNLYRQSPIYVK